MFNVFGVFPNPKTESHNCFLMSRQKLRVVFARNPPDAFDNCHEFPTYQPYLQCPFPGWCIEANGQIGQLNWGTYDPKDKKWSGVLGYLSNNTADTACLFYQRTDLRAQFFNFSYPIINVSPNYVVHSRQSYLASNIWNAFTPYEGRIWTCILIFLILQIAYLVFVAKIETGMGRRAYVKIPEMIWNLFRLQLYQPFQVDFYTLGGNLTILMFSLLQCRLFLDMYQNVLLSALLKSSNSQPFNSADELLDLIGQNSYKLITNYYGNWYFEELETSNNTHFRKLREAIKKNSVRVVKTVDEALKEVATGRFIFPIQEDSLAAFYAAERCDLAHVPNKFSEKSSHFVFRQNSELLDPFNKAITNNLDFVRRTFDKYFRHNFKISKRTVDCSTNKAKEQNTSLGIISLFGVIAVCVVGLIFSLIAFASEFYISWQHKMIRLRFQARRAIMDPLNLMAIANFSTSRILATPDALNSRRKSKFLSMPVKIFPTNKRRKKKGLMEVEAWAEDDV
ncbi:PBPb domain-containing protein [Aphelenchoides bicaudatus]|nr:PBPb domain-containing protein [Aphelenchoides bicaudatus]